MSEIALTAAERILLCKIAVSPDGHIPRAEIDPRTRTGLVRKGFAKEVQGTLTITEAGLRAVEFNPD